MYPQHTHAPEEARPLSPQQQAQAKTPTPAQLNARKKAEATLPKYRAEYLGEDDLGDGFECCE